MHPPDLHGSRAARAFCTVLVLSATLTACGGAKKSQFNVNTNSPVVSIDAAVDTFDPGQSVVVNGSSDTPGNSAVTWSLSGAGTLSNQTPTSVTYTAPATIATASRPTLTATSLADPAVSSSLVFWIGPSPTITTTSLPAATVGAGYDAALSYVSGAGGSTMTVSTGALPGWATLAGEGTGYFSIVGKPAAMGTYSFSLVLTDQSGVSSPPQPLTLTVGPAPVAVATDALPVGAVGSPFGVTLQASGGIPPYSWSIAAGSLPAWASLDAATGALSGVPTAAGEEAITVEAQDSASPPVTASRQFLLDVPAAGADDAEFKGQYAILLQDSSVPAALVGSVTADGAGHITGGEFDCESATGALTADAVASGAYSVGSDRRGTLTFSDSSGHSFGFNIAIGSISGGVAGWGGITESDGAAALTGRMDLQTGAPFLGTALLGNYAFGVGGDTGKFAEAGSVEAIGSEMVGGMEDDNLEGNTRGPLSFTGTIAALDADGRAAVTTTSTSAAAQFAAYEISPGRLDLVVVGAQGSLAIAGTALAQSGTFDDGSLAGNVIVWLESGDCPIGCGAAPLDAPEASFSFPSFSGDGKWYPNVPDSFYAPYTYSVTSGSRGRVAIQNMNVVAYLIAPDSAFLLETGPVGLGRILPNTEAKAVAASIQGTYTISTMPAFGDPTSPLTHETGMATFDGAGNVTETLDAVQPGAAAQSFTTTDTYDAWTSNGFAGNANFWAVPISPTHLLVLRMSGGLLLDPLIFDLRQ
jgi:hypothetical protein